MSLHALINDDASVYLTEETLSGVWRLRFATVKREHLFKLFSSLVTDTITDSVTKTVTVTVTEAVTADCDIDRDRDKEVTVETFFGSQLSKSFDKNHIVVSLVKIDYSRLVGGIIHVIMTFGEHQKIPSYE